MNFALSEDHVVLRQSARTFLEKEISFARVLVPGATVADADYDANWAKIVALGWQGLVIDEAYDGLGLSCIDLTMILGEMGRSLAPSPFLGTLFGAWALQKGGSAEQKTALLPGVAAGTTKLAVAVAEASGATDGPCRECTVRGDKLTGVKSFVIDAAAADWLIVAAQDEAAGRRAFFLVDARQPGVTVDLLPWRDVTRQVADVRLKDAKAELIAKLPLFADCSKKELGEIATVADELDLPAGRTLIRQGDHGREFLVIADGEASVTRNGRKLRDLGSGDWAGEIALLSDVPRTATVVTTSPVRLLVVTDRAFKQVLERMPSIATKLLQSLSERLHATVV